MGKFLVFHWCVLYIPGSWKMSLSLPALQISLLTLFTADGYERLAGGWGSESCLPRCTELSQVPTIRIDISRVCCGHNLLPIFVARKDSVWKYMGVRYGVERGGLKLIVWGWFTSVKWMWIHPLSGVGESSPPEPLAGPGLFRTYGGGWGLGVGCSSDYVFVIQ